MSGQPSTQRLPRLRGGLLLLGLLIALVLAGVASHYASSDPDGLTKVAQEEGFAASEKESATEASPLAGYGTSGVESVRLSGGIAGVTGVVATFTIAGGVLLLVRRRFGDDPAVDSSSKHSADVGAQ